MNKKIKYLSIIIMAVIIIFIAGGAIKNNSAINKLFSNKSDSEESDQQEISDNTKVDDNQQQVVEEEQDKQEAEPAEEAENINDESQVQYIDIAAEQVQIPILMYHSISAADPENGLLVAPEEFEAEVAYLKENGFTTLSLGEAVEAMKTGHVPEKPVVISFDDGYVDNYTDAFNILKKYEMKGTFFIITDNTDGGGYMSLDMLKEMRDAGMDLENHTAHHLDLSTLSYDDQLESIKSGQDFLKENAGVDSEFVCYPSGKYNDTTIEVLNALGIKGAVTTEYGIATAADGNYELKRIRIAPMSIDTFASIFSSFTE